MLKRDASKRFSQAIRSFQYGPPLAPLRESALQARAQLERAGAGEIAYVFGTERSGLENAHVDLCQACAAIPANPAFASLNLAQAVQVAAYEAALAEEKDERAALAAAVDWIADAAC